VDLQQAEALYYYVRRSDRYLNLRAHMSDTATPRRHSFEPREAIGGAGGVWYGREAVVATKHGKESVLIPPLAERVGLRLDVPPGIDTDIFGTYDGSAPRQGTLKEVAIEKATYGAALAHAEIGIASEGAYGPHPTLPFVSGGMEVLVLVDRKLGLTLVEHMVVDRPVFVSETIASDDALEPVLQRAGFPSHALMIGVERSPDHTEWVRTGVHDRDELAATISRLRREDRGLVRLASDMRADRNPTRMRLLAELAERFAHRLATECPECGFGGFGWVAYLRGLPCEECGGPTRLARGEVHGCVRCAHTAEVGRRDGLEVAGVDACPSCGPERVR